MTRVLVASAALTACLLLGAIPAEAQPAAPSPYPTFADDTPLTLRISGPLRQIYRDRERSEYDALIEWREPDGREVAHEIEIRTRGNSRADPVNCEFPPLSLDFPRSEVGETTFAGQNRLKLVTLCNRSGSYEDYLRLEFLIYRMFNRLTERSFRVRWAEVEYIDTDDRRARSRLAPAFLIEADWEVAERLGMELYEQETIEIDSLVPAHTALLTLFHYLIGNTDWNMIGGITGEPCCHNGKVVQSPEGSLIVVPYDFDNSGLVNAEYAVPPDNLPIRAVTQRLYRGFCAMNAEVTAAVDELNRVRPEFEAMLEAAEISNATSRRVFSFIERSFENINDPDRFESQILERCRGSVE